MLTNASGTNITTNKKVAILVDNYFEEAEFVEPKKALEASGISVTVVSTRSGPLTAMKHAKQSNNYQINLRLDQVEFDDYDALVVPGGVINADKLRMDERACDWVRHCSEANKPCAVICHGPWLLVSAGLAKGRRLTSYYTVQDDIRNAGGEWLDEPVVVDGPFITSRAPDDLHDFNLTLLTMLGD